MPPWCTCTCLFCIGWLQNVQRFITHAESLYDSLNPLFCNVFTTVVVCARSLLLSIKVTISTYQCSVYFYIFDLNLHVEVIEKFQAKNYHPPQTVPFVHGNFWKFAPEFLVKWYIVSAHGLGRAYWKAVFLVRSSDNKSAR